MVKLLNTQMFLNWQWCSEHNRRYFSRSAVFLIAFMSVYSWWVKFRLQTDAVIYASMILVISRACIFSRYSRVKRIVAQIWTRKDPLLTNIVSETSRASGFRKCEIVCLGYLSSRYLLISNGTSVRRTHRVSTPLSTTRFKRWVASSIFDFS